MQIKDLAKLLNVSEADCTSFIECLKVWTAKGFTIEQAIERHMAQMNRLLINSNNPNLRDIANDAYDDLREKA